MTVDYDPDAQTRDRYKRQRPFLVYTRKYGWIVCQPVQVEDEPYVLGCSRPGRIRIMAYDVLARADLPQPPDEAL